MRLVTPIEITDSMLTSTIPEPDSSVGEVEWSAGTYATGTQRIKSGTHLIYQVVADPSTSDDPEVGVLKSPKTWDVVGATNKYRMFDEIINSQSTDAGPDGEIVVEFAPGAVINSLSVFNISAQTANVTVTDPVAGEVYNRDIDLRDNSAVVDYYEYFFSSIVEKSQFTLFDLPAYPNATTTLTVGSTNGVAIGECVVGQQSTLGITQYGTSFNLLNFNTLERDSFGSLIRTTGRTTADRFDYKVKVAKTDIQYVRDQLRAVNDIACVWAGTGEEDDATLVYGYYRDVQINYETPILYDASIQIEGLI